MAAATGPPAVKPAVQPAVTRSAPTAAAPVTVHKTSVVETGSGDQVYTGEKIALDFYDTDIKNVFRILQEISGKNFAIDKNVTGKVTLALQKPVPWDQVLDLVLKMNQLGMCVKATSSGSPLSPPCSRKKRCARPSSRPSRTRASRRRRASR